MTDIKIITADELDKMGDDIRNLVDFTESIESQYYRLLEQVHRLQSFLEICQNDGRYDKAQHLLDVEELKAERIENRRLRGLMDVARAIDYMEKIHAISYNNMSPGFHLYFNNETRMADTQLKEAVQRFIKTIKETMNHD